MSKKLFRIGLFVCIILVFCVGCQKSPDKEIVTSKNTSVFDVKSVVSDNKTHLPGEITQIQHNDIYFSTDGSVEVAVALDMELPNKNMPVVEVIPHYLSEEDIERVAKSLFGDAEFYEWVHFSDEVQSRSEIQEKIERWSRYTSQDAIYELLGYYNEDTIRIVKMFIDEYTQKLESAPEKVEKVRCAWKFKKAPFYLFSAEDAASWNSAKEDDMIKATVNINGVPFTFSAGTRKQDDYKANYISAYIESDSPDAIDSVFFQSQLCRTSKPTSMQIESAKEKAEKLLDQFNLGEWIVDQCYLDTQFFGEIPEYRICVNAIPIFMDIPALRQAEIYSLTDPDVYASNYQMSTIEFKFSANGDLVHFMFHSPIDIYNVLNSNVAMMNLDELLEKAKTYFTHSTFAQFDTLMMFDPVSKDVICNLDICDISYNLARIRVPDSDANYYYVPSLSFYGNVHFICKETGDTYYYNEHLMLLTINAIDGTIINSTNR